MHEFANSGGAVAFVWGLVLTGFLLLVNGVYRYARGERSEKESNWGKRMLAAGAVLLILGVLLAISPLYPVP